MCASSSLRPPRPLCVLGQWLTIALYPGARSIQEGRHLDERCGEKARGTRQSAIYARVSQHAAKSRARTFLHNLLISHAHSHHSMLHASACYSSLRLGLAQCRNAASFLNSRPSGSSIKRRASMVAWSSPHPSLPSLTTARPRQAPIAAAA